MCIRDSFIYWLKHTIGKEPITELSASKKLESLRAEGEHYLEQSFDPILALSLIHI